MAIYISSGLVIALCVFYAIRKLIAKPELIKESKKDVRLVHCIGDQYEMVLNSDSDPTRKIFKDFFKWAGYRQADCAAKGIWESGLKSLEELKAKENAELLAMKGVGEEAVKVIREKLDEYLKEG